VHLQRLQLLHLVHARRSERPHTKHGDHAVDESERIHLRRLGPTGEEGGGTSTACLLVGASRSEGWRHMKRTSDSLWWGGSSSWPAAHIVELEDAQDQLVGKDDAGPRQQVEQHVRHSPRMSRPELHATGTVERGAAPCAGSTVRHKGAYQLVPNYACASTANSLCTLAVAPWRQVLVRESESVCKCPAAVLSMR